MIVLQTFWVSPELHKLTGGGGYRAKILQLPTHTHFLLLEHLWSSFILSCNSATITSCFLNQHVSPACPQRSFLKLCFLVQDYWYSVSSPKKIYKWLVTNVQIKGCGQARSDILLGHKEHTFCNLLLPETKSWINMAKVNH